MTSPAGSSRGMAPVEPTLGVGRDRHGRPLPVLRVSEPDLGGNELAYVTECVRSGWISSASPFVRRFEERFAAEVGSAHGISTTSGTTALHLMLAAYGVGPGDEVILPAFTMIATVNAVLYVGATPRLVDADPESWNLDVDALAGRLTPATRAVLAVHTYGRPAPFDRIRRLVGEKVLVLEDAAEALGAARDGIPAGRLGAAAAFSFYANKVVTTGEGGMITTDDGAMAEKARRLRDHAFSKERHFWHEDLGFNFRMTGLQAAVGLAQLERLADLVGRRRSLAARYTERLEGLPGLTLPSEGPGERSTFWMYGLRVDASRFGVSRDGMRERLAAEGIETRTFFVPIHLQPVHRGRFGSESYPVAEALGRDGLYLPSGPRVTEEDVDRVAAAIHRARVP